MRTIEEIRGRCRIEPGDKPGEEHWIWCGGYDRKPKSNGVVYETPVIRAPDYNRDPTGQKTFVQYGARAVYNVVHRKALKYGLRAYSTCQIPGCISPHCVRAMKPTTWGRLVAADGRFKGEQWSTFHRRQWDARGRKADDDAVRAIVASPQSAQELAAQHDLDPSTIYKYRAGTARAQASMGVFAGLMR